MDLISVTQNFKEILDTRKILIRPEMITWYNLAEKM